MTLADHVQAYVLRVTFLLKINVTTRKQGNLLSVSINCTEISPFGGLKSVSGSAQQVAKIHCKSAQQLASNVQHGAAQALGKHVDQRALDPRLTCSTLKGRRTIKKPIVFQHISMVEGDAFT
jgi:hypothetical protein